MDINKMREQFEKSMLEKLVRELMVKADGLNAEAAEIIVRHTWLERDGDGYKAPVPNYCWWSWQASRESVVVELPEPEPFNVTTEESLEMDPDEYDYLESRHGAQYSTYRKCREAVEAAGIKVKP